jgi:MYXO-CTERM domain-containing protein
MTRLATVAIVAAATIAGSALAGTVDRFIVSSTIMTAPPQTAGIGGDTYGQWAADVDTATYGYVRTMMTTADFSISMASSMSISNGSFLGMSSCDAIYTIDGANPIMVDWNWGSLAKTGGWKVLNEAGNTVAALTFNAGAFTSIGGAWAQASSGVEYFNLAAGTYTFQAFYNADQMPTSSLVNFNLGAIPGPGALALIGVAGFWRSRRRR